MTIERCDFPREWLVALRDGDLRAAQLEVAEVHLRACPECRHRLAQMDEVDRLLREAPPYYDNPAARAAVKARVVTAPERPRLFGSMASGAAPRRMATALVALLVVFLAGAIWREPLGEAGDGFSDLFRQDARHTPIAASVRGTPITAPTTAAVPDGLPLGLGEAGTAEISADTATRYFRAPSGLSLKYTIDCSGSAVLVPPRDDRLSEIAGVDGQPVLVSYGLNRVGVVALTWTAGEVLHQVLVLDDGGQPLALDDALQVAGALMSEPAPPVAGCGEGR